jgi:hypothetical protein
MGNGGSSMNDSHTAIRTLYNNVVTIIEKNDTITCLDKDGKTVSIDMSAVNTEVANNEYKDKRKNEYPSVVQQLDDIYHNGIDGWKATIKTTKDKYPKS